MAPPLVELERALRAIDPTLSDADVASIWFRMLQARGSVTLPPVPSETAGRLEALAGALRALTGPERWLLALATNRACIPEIVGQMAAGARRWAGTATRRGPRGKPVEQALAAAVGDLWSELTDEAAPPRGRAELSDRTRLYHRLASAVFRAVGLAYTERLARDTLAANCPSRP